MSLIQKTGLRLKSIWQKTLQKLKRLKGSTKDIAQGFTIGVMVSFTPFVGFHLLIAVIFAKIMRKNSIAAALGTISGNPWTFPFIWYATFHTGEMLMGKTLTEERVNFIGIFKELYHAVIMLDFNLFITDILPIFIPMLIGCLPFCIMIWSFLPPLIMKMLTKRKSA